ncbi:50S ribosomal protein L28 [Sporosalibacterium faouarense]|uniref:50S ribosomal protein L28 n=1 Tax=Sporosalibacterium faouarense TaxID=516123 RepID=UPI00141C31D4|nr:50S ribosomal protein L28 [Sporosalibacterium faouarense]MTI47716.1 50S ribosomal protein L28 [Bacillota bacterium]
MAKYCEVCGKGKVSGHNVTFSDRKIKRSWSPNVRRVRAIVDGTKKRIYVCTRCLRSNKVERAI